MFKEMGELHHILRRDAYAPWCDFFEDREAKVLVDENGHPKIFFYARVAWVND